MRIQKVKKQNKIRPLSQPLPTHGERKKTHVLKFPKGFLWGASTSAYQVEGGITGNDWAISKMPPAGLACDHYNRYREDFLMAKKLKHNAHRLSLEWSRVEPKSDHWDEEAIEHYFYALDFLKKNGFKTFVTLHHFTNPTWVADLGGWANPKIVEYFVSYVSKICQTMGQYIDFWITINEPSVYAGMGYLRGVWPPFKKNPWQSYRVYQNMLSAHNKAYEIIRAYYPEARIGFAQNIAFNEAYSPKNLLDELEVDLIDWLSMDFAYKQTKNDFIGLNHYLHNRLRIVGRPDYSREKLQKSKLTDKGWEIYPRAIYEVLLRLKKFDLPIYITENGIADAQDKLRARYITSYLAAIHRAIKKGVKVKGYLYWSLLDNYEWPADPKEKTGFEMKFGLIEVDFAHKLRRKIRPSAKVYAEICKNNAIPPLHLPLVKGEKERG